MASVTTAVSILETPPATIVSEGESNNVLNRTDIPATRTSFSGSHKTFKSMTSVSTNDEQTTADYLSRQNFLARLRSLPHRVKNKILNRFSTKGRRTYVEYFHGTKEDVKALETILSKVSPPGFEDFDPQRGLQVELHVPGNNVCEKGTQGFKGLVDTGSRGYSLVRLSVVNALEETYTPKQNFSTRQQDYVAGLQGVGDKPGSLRVLGSIILQMFHPDAAEFMFHSKFYVVPDTDMPFDFLLGTDFIFSVHANISFTKKLKRKAGTIGAVGLFRRTTILQSVPNDRPKVEFLRRKE